MHSKLLNKFIDVERNDIQALQGMGYTFRARFS